MSKKENMKDTTETLVKKHIITQNKKYSDIMFMLGAIVVSFILVQIITNYVGFTKISGESMYPTYSDGDMLIYSTDISEISYGDVVLFKNSDTNNMLYIKRVVGVAGDEIVIDKLNYYRNGELLKEDYTNGYSNEYSISLLVPENAIFVLGDNRDHSMDSREIGCVCIDDVIGIVKR